MSASQIDLRACRRRQQRLLEVMAELHVDIFVSQQHEHVQWLSGVRFPWTMHCCCALHSDGRLLVVAPHKEPEQIAADDVRVYAAKWHSTLRNDQASAAADVLWDALRAARHGSLDTVRWGVEFSSCGPHYTQPMAQAPQDLEPQLYRLRRRKEPDELGMLRRAIAGTERMYQEARQIIRPGIGELEVFNALQSVAVLEFGEMMTGTGNDYQCGSRGGPPRDRAAVAGELYILDLGPAYRGYFADNARTIAVTDVSPQQQQAWEFIERAFQHIGQSVRPGLSCKQLFDEVQQILDESPCGVFNHHLGHGIGLFPHEAPHLNPHWNDTFEVGDVFTAEPGLYDPDQLRAGMRIENDYLVTDTGVELLTPFSREL